MESHSEYVYQVPFSPTFRVSEYSSLISFPGPPVVPKCEFMAGQQLPSPNCGSDTVCGVLVVAIPFLLGIPDSTGVTFFPAISGSTGVQVLGEPPGKVVGFLPQQKTVVFQPIRKILVNLGIFPK